MTPEFSTQHATAALPEHCPSNPHCSAAFADFADKDPVLQASGSPTPSPIRSDSPLRASERFGASESDESDFCRMRQVKVVPTALPGVMVIEPDVHQDARGFFVETW